MSAEGKKVAIVTGASAGIGKEAVLVLLEHGYEVHAAARRVDAMRDLEARGAHVHHLDLRRSESIAALVSAIRGGSGRVDLLINNAGYGQFGAVEEVPIAAAREQFEVNLFGMVQLTQSILPIMREQGGGRIINVTSVGGRMWASLGAWYVASKFAVEGFTDCLRNEVRPFGIDVVLVEPGGTKTEWAALAIDKMKQISGHGPYRQHVAGAERVLSMDKGMVSARVIAESIWRAASARHPKPRYVSPALASSILILHRTLGDRIFDRLWSKFYGIPARIDPAR